MSSSSVVHIEPDRFTETYLYDKSKYDKNSALNPIYPIYTVGKTWDKWEGASKIEGSKGQYAYIKFQNGPVKKDGVNGAFIQDILAICLHYLRGLREDRPECPACFEELEAEKKVHEALNWLHWRSGEFRKR